MNTTKKENKLGLRIPSSGQSFQEIQVERNRHIKQFASSLVISTGSIGSFWVERGIRQAEQVTRIWSFMNGKNSESVRKANGSGKQGEEGAQTHTRQHTLHTLAMEERV